MDTNIIHKRRLLRLARHLLYGKLAHSRFDFNTWNGGWECADGNKNQNVCGTAGCAIGECPRVFPETFRWKGNSVITRDRMWDSYNDIVGGVLTENSQGVPFFGLSQKEASALFVPAMGEPNEYHLLPQSATRYDVGNNLLRFVVKKYGKIRLTKADRACMELVNPNENVATA